MINKLAIPAAVALSMAVTSVPLHVATAASGKTDAGLAAANHKSAADSQLNLSDGGYNAWREVRGARIAIFSGNAELATKLISDAKVQLKSAWAFTKSHKNQTVIVTTGNNDRTTHWIPVDASIAIVDDFVVAPEKAKHLAKANKHLKEGKKKEAIETLKLAEVDVDYTRYLMPIERFEKALDSATALAEDGKYYQANLALLTAERSIQKDTLMLLETPKAN